MAENRATLDVDVWKWLREVIEHLGHEGMSSEESCVEDGPQIVFRVRRPLWRRNIDKELDIIDAVRIYEPDIYKRQGSKPVQRLRGTGNPTSARPPVKGLPRTFYNEDWLAQQHRPEVNLEMLKREFPWMTIINS